MAQYAVIDKNLLVTNIIEADMEFIISSKIFDPEMCILTNTNAIGGASVGFTYNPGLKIFIPPKPFKSWILNTDRFFWMPPIPYPADGNAYSWDEDTVSWMLNKQYTPEDFLNLKL